MDQLVLLMHQVMLSDRPRVNAYDQALKQAVEPGSVVIDVGAGTLALSLLALKHGAGHVYAIEADPEVAAVAERIIAINDVKEQLTLIQGDARAVRLPRKADVIVSEMMGNLGPEENMMRVLDTVARKNLRPNGRIIPRELTTTLAAIEFDDEGWGMWGRDFHGYRLDVVQEFAEPRAQLHFFQREPRLLSDAVPISDRMCLSITRPGNLHAVMGFFTADLIDGVSLSNFPSYQGCNWAVWIWPLRHTPVTDGDAVRVTVYRPSDSARSRVVTDWRLDCAISRGGGA
ncbi:50S ribosomal protein L11 methyltransferase [Nocardia transvalensis]|uniref:50S ribosomal protein L11 methyltransferase n=1 Tax=Nocardia transvalensis TaxID=37333 RepID=UPI001894F7D1|nr:50S ribosomal protein L11 methyltransferase [Nocardia transvalensis]MBF6331900.1 50S ribosomal protein L11 methyltransferase [Nocardia transvalensis]